jgi:hypothetical protein
MHRKIDEQGGRFREKKKEDILERDTSYIFVLLFLGGADSWFQSTEAKFLDGVGSIPGIE